MHFNSFVYVFAFLPLVFAGYQATRLSILSKILLFVASCVFYGWDHPWYVVPMFFTALVDYFVAQRIYDTDEETVRRRYLIFSITVNLALMSFFKYIGWATESLVALGAYTGMSLISAPIHVSLPPGVSFYTFESISYTVDVYRREFKPRRNMLDYLSFIVFFPHLVAGPIRRAADLLPRLAEYRPSVNWADASRAGFYILWGLFLKTVIADNSGGLVENFEHQARQAGHLAPGMGLLYAYAFAFQIYGDFAAYSLIARGSALLFNIDVRHNFLTPYFSQSPSEFWTRWHISLSQWLRDYLYVPLGGNRGGRLQTLRNLVITMALGGLWHGAGIFFLFWGLWHGLLLVIYRLVPIDEYLRRFLGRYVGSTVAVILFFHLVCFGWILFRATPSDFPIIWHSIMAIPHMTHADIHPFPYTLLTYYGYLVFVFAAAVMVTDAIGYAIGAEFPDIWTRAAVPFQVIMVLAAVYGIIFFGARQSNAFIYFAF